MRQRHLVIPRPRTAWQVLALLLVAALSDVRLYGGQSLILTSAPETRGVITMPTTSLYANQSKVRLEGQLDIVTVPPQTTGIWELEGAWVVRLQPGPTLQFVGFNSELVSIELGATRSLRFVAQRNTDDSRYVLEVWDQQTGQYRSTSAPFSAGAMASLDARGRRMSVGSMYFPQVPNVRIGFLRWYSTLRSLAGAPPLLTGAVPGNLLNYEFSGNLQDSSGNGVHFAFTTGTPSYTATTTWPPQVNTGGAPLTVRANSLVTLDGNFSFANVEPSTFRCRWEQRDGPISGLWMAENTCTPSFNAPVFGTYRIRLTIVDAAGQSAWKEFDLGAVATDDKGVVIVPDPRMSRILGPLIRYGANPWSWADDRHRKLADNQIGLMDTMWTPFWRTEAPGTVAVTRHPQAGSNIITGTNTQFQTDFCGGPGQTNPNNPTSQVSVSGRVVTWLSGDKFNVRWGRDTKVSIGGQFAQVESMTSDTQLTLTPAFTVASTSSAPMTVEATMRIYVWYPQTHYPGEYGRAPLEILSCDSDTQLTVRRVWRHSPTLSGLSYSVASGIEHDRWTFGSIPANYYDNVLAYYSLYYRTGIQKYRDAARMLAERFWEGPNMDRGRAYDSSTLDSDYSVAGPARGQSITGLIAWSIEAEQDVWPGLKFILDNWAYAALTIRTVLPDAELGDLREQGYMIAGTALCAEFEPDAGRKATCLNNLKNMVDKIWAPLQVPGNENGNWRNTTGRFFGNVTVTNGSTQIKLNGGETWSPSMFSVDDFGIPQPNLENGLWFFSGAIRGYESTTSGDGVYYKVTSVVDNTTAILDRPYEGTSGNKGLILSGLAGLGTQPFILGLVGGVFGHYVYDAFESNGLTAYANQVKDFSVKSGRWLATKGFDSNTKGLWYGRDYLTCEPNPAASPVCGAASLVLAGEAMRAFTTGYLLTEEETLKTNADAFYQALWCKPTGGWTCPLTSDGTFLNAIDDPGQPGAYMITQNNASNKWFGFFFGYGFASGWPAARIGGVEPELLRAVRVPFQVNSVTGATKARMTVTAPTGLQQQVLCPVSPCEVPVDIRLGNHLFQLDYMDDSNKVLAPGKMALLPVLR
jgi:hypothetical protein